MHKEVGITRALAAGTVVLALGIAGDGRADSPEGGALADIALPSFIEADRDGDAFVDSAEAASAGVRIDLGAADIDHDGRLNEPEWKRAAGDDATRGGACALRDSRFSNNNDSAL
ncbi:MAG TPA: hypothetical protein VF203_13740 [Burkholderiales bacterium]